MSHFGDSLNISNISMIFIFVIVTYDQGSFNVFVHLFLAVLRLHCCVGFSLVAASRDHSLVVVCGLLLAAASLVVEHKL